MGDFTVRLDAKGLGRLARTLRQAGADMNDLKAAYKKAADIVKPEVRSLTPVRSGRLKRSVRSGATQRAGVVRAGSKSVPYAGVQNYGWPGHNIKAQYFMSGGLDAAADEVDDIFADAIEKALAQVQGA